MGVIHYLCIQIWNDFIERDEAEQRQILEREESGHGCGWFIVGGKAGTSSIPSHGADGRKRKITLLHRIPYQIQIISHFDFV